MSLSTPGHTLPFSDATDPPPSPVVVRIPVAGPAPFNTLAVFTFAASGVVVTGTSGLLRFSLTQLTPLTVNGFDPHRPEQQRFVHSSTAFLWRMRASDESVFVIAVDEVAHRNPAGSGPVEVSGAAFDDRGHWSVQVDIGQASGADVFAWSLLLRCWVLFFEAEPPAPSPEGEQAARAGALNAAQRLGAYRHYLTLPGADLWGASQELAPLAAQLTQAQYPHQALEAQHLIVDALRGFRPSAEDRLEYVITFAQAQRTAIARMLDVNQLTLAAALTPETIAAYREYADMAEADRATITSDLAELSRELAGAGQMRAAADIDAAVAELAPD